MSTRPALLILLVLAAVAAPLIAWWSAAADAVDRREARMLAQARADAEHAAAALARRLGARLEEVREQESARPWYHYQARFNDPAAIAEGPALFPSPLASGPLDPLVAMHASVSGNGATWSVGDLGSAPPELVPSPASLRLPWTSEPPRVEYLPLDSVMQNANVQSQVMMPFAPAPRSRKPDVEVLTSPFAWLPVDPGEMRLGASRHVLLRDQHVVQTFAIDRDGVAQWLREAGGGRLVPTGSRIARAAPVSVAGGQWSVVVGFDAPLAEAQARADLLRSRFGRTFALGAALALLGALAACVLVLQAHRAARHRAAFATAAAHELRTPLAALQLHAEILESASDPAAARDAARRIARETRRLGHVVTNILGATRLERGSLPVHVEVADAVEAAREVVELQRPPLEAAGLVVELRAEAPAPASFDREAVAQALTSLLDNAERHGRGAPARRVVVSVSALGAGGAEIAVTDSGPGLPRRGREALFEPYVRSGEPRAGLGLGLALARELCRAQGGDLLAEDAPGGGARFVMRLASARPAPPALQLASDRPSGQDAASRSSTRESDVFPAPGAGSAS